MNVCFFDLEIISGDITHLYRILLVEDQDDMLIIIIKNDNDISIMWH